MDLITGEYYQFTKQVNINDEPIIFKAQFIEIIQDTLRVSLYSDNTGVVCNSIFRTMPLIWIIHIEKIIDLIID
jgi:hypothetical protein